MRRRQTFYDVPDGATPAEIGARIEAVASQINRGMLETPFVREVMREAARNGWLAFHDVDAFRCPGCGHVVRDRRRRGFPDLVLVRAPQIVLWEAKTVQGQVRPEQRDWLSALRGCTRLITGVIRPPDMPEVIRTLMRRKDTES